MLLYPILYNAAYVEQGYRKGYTQGVADGLSKVNIQYTYHNHEGSEGTAANGCYTTAVCHSHISSCYARCNGPMYVTKKGTQNSGGSWDAPIQCDWCGGGDTWTAAAQQQHVGQEFPRYRCQRVTGYSCGKTTSTVEKYTLGCGKTTETIESATIIY